MDYCCLQSCDIVPTLAVEWKLAIFKIPFMSVVVVIFLMYRINNLSMEPKPTLLNFNSDILKTILFIC